MDKESCVLIIRNLKHKGTSIVLSQGYLKVITFDYKYIMPNCVRELSKWRLENPSLSPTRFLVSDERTERWLLNSILNNDERIMFMIQDIDGKDIGHIGLSIFDYENACIRIDSVMKGCSSQYPGIMQEVINRLKKYCQETFAAQKFDLVVLSDNDRAIRLYSRCQFKGVGLIPLKKSIVGEEINWEEDYSIDKAEMYYLHMRCDL